MSIGAGCFYTVVLNHDGTLFASGFNINGCLAQGTRKHE
jgi:alpha-tubulin suppressor-like RCC1 family protein